LGKGAVPGLKQPPKQPMVNRHTTGSQPVNNPNNPETNSKKGDQAFGLELNPKSEARNTKSRFPYPIELRWKNRHQELEIG